MRQGGECLSRLLRLLERFVSLEMGVMYNHFGHFIL